jgi:Spy/CpxP family protein refolding chaperone
MKRFPQSFIFIITMVFAVSVFGQEPQDAPQPPERPVDRMNILRELGLSQDQIRQMRIINQDIRTKRQAARLRVGEATRNLDQAIYADTVDETLVAQRLRDLQDAQSEMAKVNFENEFAIRKVLNPEQLVRFREIRQKFNDARETFQRQRQDQIQNREMRRPGGDQRRGQPPADRPPVKEIRQLRPKG